MIEHRQAADDFGRQVENHVGAVASFRSACTPAIVVGQAKCSARGEGLVAWIGLLVVVQNIFTSLFNSHLFDFNEGWIYVLGAGVAGGLLKQQQRRRPSSEAVELTEDAPQRSELLRSDIPAS